MDLGLKGKNVIVTGGSRGIGRSISLAFADHGANVALCARGEEALNETAAELKQKGGKVHARSCNVADGPALEDFIDSAHEALGGVDILVNNASGFGITDDEKGWQAGFSVDMMATARASWKVIPWMAAAGDGSIVHIASISGIGSSAGTAPYGAVKAAMISYAASQAVELAPKNIRVNVVAPGPIEFPDGTWDMIRKHNEKMYEHVRRRSPFQRLGTPEEVANVAIFLASDAASWITGRTIEVDGGHNLSG